MSASAILLILAFAVFVAATALPALLPRINLIAVGLALWVAAEFVGRLP